MCLFYSSLFSLSDATLTINIILRQVKDGHKLHLLRKKAIRVISNSHYIAHTEPICKGPHMLKVSDMFRLAI